MNKKIKRAAITSIAVLLGFLSAVSSAQSESDLSLLALASVGETVAARELINRRTDANVAHADGTTPLHWAVYYNDENLLQRLIRAGAEVTVRNEYGATPLSQAAIIANPAIIKRLLNAGADVDELGADGQTALMIVSRTSNLDALKVLLDAGANPNVAESWRGQTALMWAAAQKLPEVVKLLLDSGADPDAQSLPNNWERQVTAEPRMKILPPGGLTPLLYAAREGCALCAQYMIEAGANVNKSDLQAISPLLLATLNSKWDTAGVLLNNGANPNKWDRYGRAPLYAAIDFNTVPHGGRADRLSSDLINSLEMIEMLLQAGANPNMQLKLFPPYRALGADRGADGLLTTGVTPLFRAARGADIPAMELLIEYGALVALPNRDDVTPLMVAAGFRQSGIDTRGRFRTEADAFKATQLLLDSATVDVNHQSEGGQTALFGAATLGWTDLVELLLKNGADPAIEDDFGTSVIDAAMGRGGLFGRGSGGDQHIETAAMLESYLSQ